MSNIARHAVEHEINEVLQLIATRVTDEGAAAQAIASIIIAKSVLCLADSVSNLAVRQERTHKALDKHLELIARRTGT